MTQRQLLIGLAGLPTHVIANHLQDQHGWVVIRISEPFEEAIAALIGRSAEYVRHPDTTRQPLIDTLPLGTSLHNPAPTVRSTVQAMREGFADSLHPDFLPCFLEQRLQEAAAMHGDAPGFVVPDLVYAHEASFIRRHDGVVIHVDNPTMPEWTHAGRLRASKTPKDFTIPFHGTVGDLLMNADNIVRNLRASTEPSR